MPLPVGDHPPQTHRHRLLSDPQMGPTSAAQRNLRKPLLARKSPLTLPIRNPQ